MMEDEKCGKFIHQEESFAYYAAMWLSLYKLDNVKNSTFNYSCVNPVRIHFLPYFGARAIKEIKSSQIQEYFRNKRKLLSKDTLKKHKFCLQSIFDLAIDDDIITKNPVTSRIIVASDVKSVKKEVWNQEEYDTAWNYAKTHPHGLDIMFLMETAVTRSELLGLTWQDYTAKTASVYVRNGLVSAKNPYTGTLELVHDGLKNERRRRCIPLSKELNAYLSVKPRKIQIGKHEIHPNYIFHSPEGHAYCPDNWYKWVLLKFMNDLHKATGVRKLTTHELRHTRASLLINNDKNIFAVASLMGHADLKMLRQRYVHQSADDVRTALGL